MSSIEIGRLIQLGMARAFFAHAWADLADESGNSGMLSGQEITEIMPDEIDPAAIHAAETLTKDLIRAFEVNVALMMGDYDALAFLYQKAKRLSNEVRRTDRELEPELFGHYLAMQAMGTGVGMESFGYKVGKFFERVPHCEFGSYSLTKEYFEKTFEVCLLDFHGFYESIHKANIEDAIDNMFEVSGCDDEGEQDEALESFWMAFTFNRQMQDAYCRMYVDIVKEHLKEKVNLDLPTMTFSKLTSPREYNFTTDKIYVTINESDLEKLVTMLDKNRADMIRTVRELFTPVSGFLPYYPSDFSEWNENVREWDHNELGTLIMALSDGWGDTELMQSATNFNVLEEVENIIYQYMDEAARKVLDEYVEMQEEKLSDG